MIVTELYNGSGLGNQLFNYVTTRVIALDNNYDFGIMNSFKFKGQDFMNLDFGKEVIGGYSPQEGAPPITLPNGILNYYREKEVRYNGIDIRNYDVELTKIPDNTKLDGLMQSDKYFSHRKEEIKKWLKVKDEHQCYEYCSDDICVINLRGGEYTCFPELYLTRKYWDDGIEHMRRINPNMKFVVITDDVLSAQNMFVKPLYPDFEIHHFNIAKDYSIINNARYLLLSNSSFSYFAAYTSNECKYIIAPKYWARHNVSDGYWACAFNIYSDWNWLGRDSKLYLSDECKKELEEYMINIKDRCVYK